MRNKQGTAPTAHHAKATVYAELPMLPPTSNPQIGDLWSVPDDAAGSAQVPIPPKQRHYVLDFSDGNHTEVSHRCVAGRTPPLAGESYDQYAVINDPTGETSRRHFEFGVTAAGQVWVMDLASSNGTWIQSATASRQIPPKLRQPLNVGDVLRFGSITATLRAT